MMRRLAVVLMGSVIFLAPAPVMAAEEVTVDDILEVSAELAGREVTVMGELVGDYGFRDDGWMWTQLNGDLYAFEPILEGGTPVGGNTGIGIRMPTQLGDGLDPPGGYRQRGPIVEVTGIWKYHDPERQGESYLEVETLSVLQPGRPLEEPVNWVTIIVGAALLAVASAVWFIRREE